MKRWMLWGNLGLCAVAGGLAGACIGLGLYLTAAGLILLCITTGLMPLWFKQGYRYGWLAGRCAMLTAMIEAMQRGMSAPDFIQAEMERDGVPVVHVVVEVDDDAAE